MIVFLTAKTAPATVATVAITPVATPLAKANFLAIMFLLLIKHRDAQAPLLLILVRGIRYFCVSSPCVIIMVAKKSLKFK